MHGWWVFLHCAAVDGSLAVGVERSVASGLSVLLPLRCIAARQQRGRTLAGKQEIVYRIDADDRIVFVNDQWDRFAGSNGGDDVLSSVVLGRSLWGYINGLTTRQIYRQILDRTRAGTAVVYPLRCDSPDRRRLLEMNVRLADGGAVEFRSRTLSEEPRSALGLLDRRQPRTDDLLAVCSWCEKVRVAGRWVDVEDAIAALALFQQSELPSLTHGMCQTCSESMNKVIANL